MLSARLLKSDRVLEKNGSLDFWSGGYLEKRAFLIYTEQHGEIGIRSIRFYVKYMCELAPRITM
jgi:hypothetical protein